MTQPLFLGKDLGVQRYDIIKYPVFKNLDNRQMMNFWRPEEIELKKDRGYFKEMSAKSYAIYAELSEAGIARELARAILPVNLYTEWYWKNDLHNILHFLSLRLDKHAQYEIRIYAEAMAKIIVEIVPIVYEAFEDYVLNGMRYSRVEQSLLSKHLPDRVIGDILEDLSYQITATLQKNKPRHNDELYQLYQSCTHT